MLPVQVWSDIACPWCYIGKRRLEAALAGFAHADQVEVTWRSFELDPHAERDQGDVRQVERLARKYRTTPAQAQAMIDRVATTAAGDGLTMNFDRVRSTNTFDGHRLLHFARAAGQGGAMKERLMKAYFTDGEMVGDRETLARLAGEVGLDRDQAAAVLATDRFAAEVREDEELARDLGISGVPFFVIGSRIGVSGAQPAEVLRGALEKGWTETVGQ